MNAEQIRYKLEISAVGMMVEFAHFTLYNNDMAEISKAYHCLNVDLPKGIYCVQMAFNDTIEQKMIRLAEDTKVQFETPEIFSSVTALGYKTSHEYYTNNAEHYSLVPTATFTKLKNKVGSLFLFFRYADGQSRQAFNRRKASLGRGFSILDSNRKRLCYLSGKNVREDRESGWLAFNCELPSGNYYLNYKGRKPKNKKDFGTQAREIPLNIPARKVNSRLDLSDNWQTQLFLLFTSGPVFTSGRINITSGREGFKASDAKNYVTDGIVQKFQNGISYIPEGQLRELAFGKWKLPMQGILSAYIYFNGTDPLNSSPKTEALDGLFQSVSSNLSDILSDDSPDANAIKLLAADYYKTALPTFVFNSPPMFLSGVKAAIRLSVTKQIVEPGSILEQIGGRLYNDLIYTSYDPMPIVHGKRQAVLSELLSGVIGSALHRYPGHPSTMDDLTKGIDDFNFPVGKGVLKKKGNKPPFTFPPGILTQEWINDGLKDLLSSKVATNLLNYAGYMEKIKQLSDSRSTKTDEPLMTIQDAAQRLQVTPNVIEQTIKSFELQQKSISQLMEEGKMPDKLSEVFSLENIETLKKIIS
ncbi:hypothetical protein [Dyadobacter sp. LHD-138]|uniref:hypothetical protein n=1 Tax=Dyadobacter sp. LHD-138 TaxID=3071413 RepID=UPI0027DFBBC6|nr:hypothetical protein [Dyadobacter sp. LHD-138]MDQ6482417.1 hypothetical protein [Dyadobacter sp. LHD-138]